MSSNMTLGSDLNSLAILPQNAAKTDADGPGEKVVETVDVLVLTTPPAVVVTVVV
jgi:hypothetical protein